MKVVILNKVGDIVETEFRKYSGSPFFLSHLSNYSASWARLHFCVGSTLCVLTKKIIHFYKLLVPSVESSPSNSNILYICAHTQIQIQSVPKMLLLLDMHGLCIHKYHRNQGMNKVAFPFICH